jgi:hypothetical protein
MTSAGDFTCLGQIPNDKFDIFKQCKKYTYSSYVLRVLYFEGLAPNTDANRIYEGKMLPDVFTDYGLPFKCVKEDIEGKDNITRDTVSQTESYDEDFIKNKIAGYLDYIKKEKEGNTIKLPVANNTPIGYGVKVQKKGSTNQSTNPKTNDKQEKREKKEQEKREKKEQEKRVKKEQEKQAKKKGDGQTTNAKKSKNSFWRKGN